MNRYKDILPYLAIPALAGIIFFVLAPIYLIGQAPQKFSFLEPSIFFPFALSAALFFALGLGAVTLALRAFGLKRTSVFLLFFSLTWIVVAGFILPAVKSDGMVNPTRTDINVINLAAVILLSAIAGALSVTKIRSAVYVFVAVVVATSTLPALPTFINLIKADPQTGQKEIAHISKERNIIVLSFDGIPANVARDVFENEPDIRKAFKDFLFFENAVAVAPATGASLRNAVFGNKNFRALGETNAEVQKHLDLSDLPLNQIQDSFTYGSYGRFNQNAESKVLQISESSYRIPEHRYWFGLIAARVGTKYGAAIFQRSRLLYFAEHMIPDQHNQFPNYVGPEWKEAYLRQISDFEALVDNLKAVKDGLSIRYMHFIHTHFPVDFDKDCNYRSDCNTWHEANQNYSGLYNQAICEFNHFADFVGKLKEMGVYDNSLIVFKSDHGEPVSYFDEKPHNLRINNHEHWGLNRYRPLLMIKDFKRKTAELEINAELVTLGDLARTICIRSELEDIQCDIFPGINLLDAFDISESPELYVDVVTDESSTFCYDTHKTIPVVRDGRAFVDILKDSDLADLME